MTSFLSNNTFRIGRAARLADLDREVSTLKIVEAGKPTKTIQLDRDFKEGWDLPTLWAERRLGDQQALDLISLILASPEWATSYIEDICEIVERTGRNHPSMIAFDGETFEWYEH